MALTYTLDKIADWKEVCFLTAQADDPNRGVAKGDRILNPVTETLIFAVTPARFDIVLPTVAHLSTRASCSSSVATRLARARRTPR